MWDKTRASPLNLRTEILSMEKKRYKCNIEKVKKNNIVANLFTDRYVICILYIYI